MSDTIFEIGDDLQVLALKAKTWFSDNNVACPSSASNWQRASVKLKQIPPGMGVSSLRRYGFNVTKVISLITENPLLKAYVCAPLVSTNLEETTGLVWLSDITVKGHKRVLTKCTACGNIEELDYGTLQRMVKSNNKFCRYCRNAGGKPKELITYDIFKGFTIKSKSDSRYTYECHSCSNSIERTSTTVSNAEYLVCEYCFPERNFGARQYTELGYFDSKIEYEAYKILLKYLSSELIERQKKYDELFSTGSKHTADFYISSAGLVLEVTSRYNKLGGKYRTTAMWKQSLTNSTTKVLFAYSLKEVEDIVRPIAKALGLTVANS